MASTGTYSAAPARTPHGVAELVLARVPRVSRDGVAIARRGCIEWANAALGALLGVDPDALVGLALTRIDATTVDPADQPLDLTRLCHDGLAPVVVVLRASGTAVAVESTRLDGGTDDQWVLTFRGVSRQVRADED